MSRFYCEQEQRVFAALAQGTDDASLGDHLSRCPICAEIMRIAPLLRQDASALESQLSLPSAESLWWKAQLRSRRAAVVKAIRPIDLVTRLGLAALVVTCLWFVSFSPQSQAWIAGVARAAVAPRADAPYWQQFALLGGFGTIVCVLIGSLLTLRVSYHS